MPFRHGYSFAVPHEKQLHDMGKFQNIAPSLRIMVVEDDYLQADHLVHAIHASGNKVVGPFSDVHEAIHYVDTVHAAILDIRVKDDTSFDIANSLKNRSIPFVFLTGYEEAKIPLHFDRQHIYQKPTKMAFILQDLHRQYSEVLSFSASSAVDIVKDILLVAHAMMPDTQSAERIVETILLRAIHDANSGLTFDLRDYLLSLLTEEFSLGAHRYLH